MIAIGAAIVSPAPSTRSVIDSILTGLVRSDCLLQIFQPELQLIGIQLLRAAAEPMSRRWISMRSLSFSACSSPCWCAAVITTSRSICCSKAGSSGNRSRSICTWQ